MLGGKKVGKILDTVDGVGTGSGASLDELKYLLTQIKFRIDSAEALAQQTKVLLAQWRAP